MADTPVAIVTGASSGVGRDAALLLAEAGYAVALLARRAEKLNETAQQITEQTPTASVTCQPTDVTDPEAAQRAVEAVLDAHGRVDALVNAAGDAPLQPIEKISDEVYRRCIDSNLSGVVYLTRAVWPTLQKQRSGCIVNISSMASIDPFKGFNIYAAAKAGVNLFTRCCADEARGQVKAVAVAPGAIETPMLRANFSEKALPKDKTLDPSEVAQVVVDCITGRREFTNGETIQVPSP